MFHWKDKEACGWAIYYGVSKFLVAEGSGFSRAYGLHLFSELTENPEAFRSILEAVDADA